MKLLIAEDDPDVADVVAFGARIHWPGCEVIVTSDGEEALTSFENEAPDLVILDISMPPPDGFEVCRRIRAVSQVPIMMLTGREDTLDKLRALDMGADDYLTKPFDHLELLARLRALLRRTAMAGSLLTGAVASPHQGVIPPLPLPASPQNATFGDLMVNFTTREVRICDKPVALTSTEYRLLEELVRRAGTVLPHSFLLERVWGPEYVGEDHYLKVFIRRLRRKLGDDAEQPRYIQTEWGIGYRFIPQSPRQGEPS